MELLKESFQEYVMDKFALMYQLDLPASAIHLLIGRIACRSLRGTVSLKTDNVFRRISGGNESLPRLRMLRRGSTVAGRQKERISSIKVAGREVMYETV